MDARIVVAIAVGPGIFWLWYFYAKDKYEPEPMRLILKTFVLGMIVLIPVFFMEIGVGAIITEFLLIAVGAPVIEELAKYAVVWKFIYRDTEFDEPIDGIVYAIAAALGFATLENILFIFSACAVSETQCLTVGFIRAILSVPSHALFSGIWGYALGQAKFMEHQRGDPIIIAGISLGIILHAIFNFLLITTWGFALLMLILVPGMWWMMRKRIRASLFRRPL